MTGLLDTETGERVPPGATITVPVEVHARLIEDNERLRREWQRECEDADLLLQSLGLCPSEYRSEGGSLLLGRIQHAVKSARERELADANALVESLQNKWATRPLSPPDGEALIAENERLERELGDMIGELRVMGDRYQDRTEEADKLRRELDEARGLLREWRATADVAKDMTFVPVAKRTDALLTPPDQPTACNRQPKERCNHADPGLCCGGGYDGPCDCDCHSQPGRGA